MLPPRLQFKLTCPLQRTPRPRRLACSAASTPFRPTCSESDKSLCRRVSVFASRLSLLTSRALIHSASPASKRGSATPFAVRRSRTFSLVSHISTAMLSCSRGAVTRDEPTARPFEARRSLTSALHLQALSSPPARSYRSIARLRTRNKPCARVVRLPRCTTETRRSRSRRKGVRYCRRERDCSLLRYVTTNAVVHFFLDQATAFLRAV